METTPPSRPIGSLTVSGSSRTVGGIDWSRATAINGIEPRAGRGCRNGPPVDWRGGPTGGPCDAGSVPDGGVPPAREGAVCQQQQQAAADGDQPGTEVEELV